VIEIRIEIRIDSCIEFRAGFFIDAACAER
jgi:hypothetical protein